MKKFKVDGGVKLCFEKGHCETMLEFKDLPLHYQLCNASNENMPFQGMFKIEYVDIYQFTWTFIIHCISESSFSYCNECLFYRCEL